MPGEMHAPFAVLSQTWRNTIPLIYSGQEEPFLDSLSFFYKDTITFGKYQRAPFYKTLLTLRKENPALSADAAYNKLNTMNDEEMYAFVREKNGRKIVVLLNFSSKPQSTDLKGVKLSGSALNVFSGKKEDLKDGQIFQLAPWGYLVYSY
jgi:glycosidase